MTVNLTRVHAHVFFMFTQGEKCLQSQLPRTKGLQTALSKEKGWTHLSRPTEQGYNLQRKPKTRKRDHATTHKSKQKHTHNKLDKHKTKQNKTSQNHNAQSRGSHHCRLRLRLPVLPPLSESSLLRPIAWRVPERERRLLNHTRTRENVRFNSSASSCTRSGLG